MVLRKGVARLQVKGGDFTGNLFVFVHRVGEFFDLAALLGGEGTVAVFGRFGLASHERVLRWCMAFDGFTVERILWRR